MRASRYEWRPDTTKKWTPRGGTGSRATGKGSTGAATGNRSGSNGTRSASAVGSMETPFLSNPDGALSGSTTSLGSGALHPTHRHSLVYHLGLKLLGAEGYVARHSDPRFREER